MKVSVVPNATDTKTREREVVDVSRAIRDGGKGAELKRKITQIRNRFELEREIFPNDLTKAKKSISGLKLALPAVLWSGTFSERNNDGLIQHSGLLCADLDNLGQRLGDVHAALRRSPYLWALFLSPSGDGLKAVFRVPADPARHLGSYLAAEKHVRDETGIHIDTKGKDVARLCFMSYDPELYHNPAAIQIEPLAEPEKPKRVPPHGEYPPDLNARERIADNNLGALTWSAEKGGYFCKCPGEHLHTNGTSEKHTILFLDNVPTLACQHESCQTIIEAFNAKLRSEIGKTKYRGNSEAQCFEVNTEPAGLAPPPVPYVPPPLALLPSSLQDYVHAAAESLSVDIAFVLLPTLSSLGAAIGNARSIILKSDYIEPPIIWTGIVSSVGTKKSPAVKAGCLPVIQHERDLARQNAAASECYAEELANWEAKNKKERGPKPEPPAARTCMMDDLTIESLIGRLESNPRGVLLSKDEISNWIASFDQYRSGGRGADVSRWLSLHTGVQLCVDRCTDQRSYRIWDPRVCITGGIQPGILRRVMKEEFFERGLPARFLLAYPPLRQNRWSDTTVADDLCRGVANLFDALWLLQPGEHGGAYQPQFLGINREAKGRFVSFYNECGQSGFESAEREAAAWSKLTGYCARLALVGQLARHPEAQIVTGEVIQAACDLARWFGNEAVRIYAALAETREQGQLRKLVEFIESRGGSVRPRDVANGHWPLKNQADKAEQLLDQLVKLGLARRAEVRHGARGPMRHEFQLLPTSTSTSFGSLRGEKQKPVDVDAGSSQKTTATEEPRIECVSGQEPALKPNDILIGKDPEGETIL